VPPLLPGPAPRGLSIRRWITRTFSGRAIAAGVLVKALAFALRLAFGRWPLFELIDTAGDVALVTGAIVVGYRIFVDGKQRVLWRVRRKLTLSYIFIGFVPALLIVTFFLVSGLLLFLNIGAYMTQRQLNTLIDETRFVAESTALGVQRAADPPEVARVLATRGGVFSTQYPGASLALVPASRACGAVGGRRSPGRHVFGPWAHLPAPVTVPAWIPCTGYAGLITYSEAGQTRIAARALVWPDGLDHAVVVDAPIGEAFARELREEAGVLLDNVTPSVPGSNSGADQSGQWRASVDRLDWDTGESSPLDIRFRIGLMDVYERISAASSVTGTRDSSFSQGLLLLLAAVGVLFLIIQGIAFAMGLALAQSITGSVHELFAGTERIRRGDFTGRIAIRSRDQLGELAESFNSMTASIEDLLVQKAEKERMEQELRIARSIQMSLLPQGPMKMRGLSVTAHCEPAREVGGDYYDFLPIDDHTVGILVADVSGKGTSAALYMAELKGIVLSLSQRHTSPRDLLIEADRIISRHLDSRSFITVSYLLVDLRARTLQYARAGHCPLIYMPGSYCAERTPQLIAPDGLVLGLQLDGGETFRRLLDEVTLPLGPGDLFVLYTDGMSEAMNAEGDCFGDARLAALVGEHPDLSADELRERILRDIGAFAGVTAQHDDMTMVLLRVDEVVESLSAAV
jgi:serine phosphatase RsbU (regulator of sigma subunit)